MTPLEPGLSAPDLTGPVSILNWPTTFAGSRPARKSRPFSHVRLEVDLRRESVRMPTFAVLDRLESLLKEREIVEGADLLRLAAQALHAFAGLGFRRVDHWEVEPGGWLPLPEASHAELIEPLGHLLRALENPGWKGLAARRAFSVRLSGAAGYRADLVVRRMHRERRHAVSIDLRGRITRSQVRDVAAALARRLPVLRVVVSEYAHA